MAIALVNSTHVVQSSAATIVINKPASTVDNNAMFAIINQDITTPNADCTGPASWVKIGGGTVTTHMRTTVWRKLAASEGASYTWTTIAGALALFQGIIVSLSGVDTTTFEDIAVVMNSANTGTSLTSTGGTTVTDGAWIMSMYDAWNATTLTKDASATQIVAQSGGGGDLMRVDQKTISPAGASGNVVATQDASGNEWVAASVFVRPSGAAAVVGRVLQMMTLPLPMIGKGVWLSIANRGAYTIRRTKFPLQTDYTQDLAGTLTFTGAIQKGTSRNLPGTLSFTGALQKATSRLLAGVLSFTGGLQKGTSRALSGQLSFTGALGAIHGHVATLAGTLSFTGAFQRGTGKQTAGTLSFTGAIKKATTRAFSGGLSFSGAFSGIKTVASTVIRLVILDDGTLALKIANTFYIRL